MDIELLNHYKDTDYWFTAKGQRISLTIGQKSHDFDRLCERLDCNIGVFLTASNPYSKLLPESENKNRNDKLAARLKQMDDIFYFSGKGQDRDSEWPAEESFMIFGLSQETAIDLAQEYQQNALVWIEYQQAAVLIDV